MFIRMLLHFAAFVSIYLNKLFFECRGYRGRFYLDISNVVVCFHNVDGKQQNALIADYALNYMNKERQLRKRTRTETNQILAKIKATTV
jgi:hypothetical protein